MTATSSQEDGVSRREFMVTAGTAAIVGGAVAATGTVASAETSANEICRMDAVTLAGKIRTKQLSPTEVTEAVLARIDKVNPVIGAFCTPAPDVARAQAKAVEADIMAGKTVGPLAGVPVGIKDLVYTKGIKTTSGSIAYKDYVPTEDDVVVERLKAAGAIILGKTKCAGVRL
jgi:aspartyl-tRNA(Asn)/glutamyl-tRNA(Gln) amidotransferase subunit A